MLLIIYEENFDGNDIVYEMNYDLITLLFDN